MDSDRFYGKLSKKLELEKIIFSASKEPTKLQKRNQPIRPTRGRDPRALPWEDKHVSMASLRSPSAPTAARDDPKSTRELLEYMQHSLLPPIDTGVPLAPPSPPTRSPEPAMMQPGFPVHIEMDKESPVVPCFRRRRSASVNPTTSHHSNKSWQLNNTPRPTKLAVTTKEPAASAVPLNTSAGKTYTPWREIGTEWANNMKRHPEHIDSEPSTPFENPRAAPEPVKSENNRSENTTPTELVRSESMRSTRSLEKLKALKFGFPTGVARRDSVRERNSDGSGETTKTQTVQSPTSKTRKDSVVDTRSPESRQLRSNSRAKDDESSPVSRSRSRAGSQAGSRAESRAGSRAESRAGSRPPTPGNILISRPMQTRDPSPPTESVRNPGPVGWPAADGLLAAICMIDRNCSKQAERYALLKQQRVQLQNHILSKLGQDDGFSKDSMRERHNRLVMMNAEMDRIVSAMLEDQRQKTAWVQSMVAWNQAGSQNGVEGKKEREGSGQFTMSYDTVMKFLDSSTVG